MKNEETGDSHQKSPVQNQNPDHQSNFEEEAYLEERKMSGKFSGLEKMKKSRNDDDLLNKEDEKVYLFNLF